MKKIFSLMLLGVMFLFVLAGCGSQSKEDVVGDLSKKLEQLEGYKANAVMTFNNGEKQQKYNAEIWYQKPDQYKVVIQDDNKENKQMIIKNNGDVFVLTPALNKKYHFESDWPNNRSQTYLFQSLAKDIVNDANAKFENKENNYVFTTKTNYQTKLLTNQKITLNKKDLAPKGVKVMDQDMNVVIDIQFKDFKFGPKFNKSDFDVDKNMTSMALEVPAMAVPDEKFKLYQPTVDIDGASLAYSKDVSSDGNKKFIIKYTGKKGYTLVETKSEVAEASATVDLEADPVNLGFTVGAMTDHSLTWSHDGMDYYLVSDDLTSDEMVKVAQSVVGQVTK
ncbi:outer membrane lipoprotein-sorting protein [Pullulanibacillus pueri]|uniref:Sporulation protein YdcC n=1 Tax=Pullulanibacillus pueri TaxID=1437324 RepID=A0A8J3ENZ9_9BACL|nr:outer membrane lipoprotein carrier protein LolA [Pullulanibacillus pueri]MBM7683800.1 outer membrane lipoprotein-sorting protein [Pullulanibacillus pueri]GGH87634.1 sporulation protein YdcC [Pullulanibacillus pueri]